MPQAVRLSAVLFKGGEFMKKTYSVRMIITFLFVLSTLLSACQNTSSSSSPDGSASLNDCQRGFSESSGSPMAQSPDGYYTFLGNYLVFMTPDMDDYTLVCNKPDCLHNEEPIETTIECNAYFMGIQMPPTVQYYDGFLYIPASSTTEKETGCIYKVALDGSSRTAIFDSPNRALKDIILHRGYCYAYEQTYESSAGNPTVKITGFPLDQPEQQEILFSSSQYSDPGIYNMFCKDNALYFRLSGHSQDGDQTDFLKIDLDSKELLSVCQFPDEAKAGNDGSTSPRAYFVGGDQITAFVLNNYNAKSATGQKAYYCFDMDGAYKGLLPEGFDALENGATISAADDQYIYAEDAYVGEDVLPASERRVYVYHPDGTLAGTVDVSGVTVDMDGLPDGYIVLPGNEDFFIIRNTAAFPDYYRVDKADLDSNTTISPRLVLEYSEEYLRPSVITIK